MSAPLRIILREVEALFRRESRGLAHNKHRVGYLVDHVITAESKYGSKAVKQLGVYLGTHPSELYRARRFCLAYSVDQLDEIIAKLPTEVTFGRLELLAHFPVDRRLELLNLIAQQKISIREFRDLIWREAPKDVKTRPRAARTGRPPRRPSSPAAGAVEMAKHLETLIRRADLCMDCVVDEVLTTSVSSFDDNLLLLLRAAKARVCEARIVFEQLGEKTQKGIDRVSAVLAARTEVAAN